MAIELKLKRSETASSSPTTSDIAVGEVAMNLADRVLYSRDSSNNIVKIATTDIVHDTTPQLGGNLDLNSNNITGTGDIGITGDITITSTDASSTAGPELVLYRNSSSPADADYLGQLQFKGKHDGGGDEIYAKVTGKIRDATQGTEDGIIETSIKGNGSFTIVSRQRSDELQLLNGTSLSVDGSITVGSGGITFSDGTTQSSAGTTQGFAIAMGVALG